MVIGRGGKGIEDLKKEIIDLIKKNDNTKKKEDKDGEIIKKAKMNVQLTVKEVREPYLRREIVKQLIIADIEKRLSAARPTGDSASGKGGRQGE